MAFEAGADMISVCAQASVETISGAIEETRGQNKKVFIDLIGSRDWLLISRETKDLFPDFFCIHTGLDEQMKGKKPFGFLEDFLREINQLSESELARLADIAVQIKSEAMKRDISGYTTRELIGTSLPPLGSLFEISTLIFLRHVCLGS